MRTLFKQVVKLFQQLVLVRPQPVPRGRMAGKTPCGGRTRGPRVAPRPQTLVIVSAARRLRHPPPSPFGGDPATPRPPPPPAGYVRPKYCTWASLLERTFAIDVLACPECGGRLRLITTITDARVIDKILRHLGLPTETALPKAAQVAGWLPGVEPPADWITE
jgi:hypothetical protein